MCSKTKRGWDLNKKYTSRLETCVARQKRVDFRLEVHIGTYHMCSKAKMVELR